MAKAKAALRKSLKKEIYEKLKVALLSYKDDLKKSDFEKKIKKLSKAFGESVAKVAGKKESGKKKIKSKAKPKEKKTKSKEKK